MKKHRFERNVVLRDPLQLMALRGVARHIFSKTEINESKDFIARLDSFVAANHAISMNSIEEIYRTAYGKNAPGFESEAAQLLVELEHRAEMAHRHPYREENLAENCVLQKQEGQVAVLSGKALEQFLIDIGHLSLDPKSHTGELDPIKEAAQHSFSYLRGIIDKRREYLHTAKGKAFHESEAFLTRDEIIDIVDSAILQTTQTLLMGSVPAEDQMEPEGVTRERNDVLFRLIPETLLTHFDSIHAEQSAHQSARRIVVPDNDIEALQRAISEKPHISRTTPSDKHIDYGRLLSKMKEQGIDTTDGQKFPRFAKNLVGIFRDALVAANEKHDFRMLKAFQLAMLVPGHQDAEPETYIMLRNNPYLDKIADVHCKREAMHHLKGLYNHLARDMRLKNIRWEQDDEWPWKMLMTMNIPQTGTSMSA